MPGKWDGKSRPSNNTYRKNFDDIFRKKDKDNDGTRKTTKADKRKAGQPAEKS